jgi:hypothetical protein
VSNFLQSIASAADGETLLVQQTADSTDHQNFMVLVVTAVAAPFHGPQLGELLFPVTQDMGLDGAQLADFTDGEIAFGRYSG